VKLSSKAYNKRQVDMKKGERVYLSIKKRGRESTEPVSWRLSMHEGTSTR